MMDKDLNMYVKANTLLRAVHIECLLILKLQKNNDYVDNNNKLCVCVCVCVVLWGCVFIAPLAWLDLKAWWTL